MQFLYPSFLFALFAISIPIIIHLLNFRRYKKVLFSDVRFLFQINAESKKRTQLKHWLILLSRILLITSLVFAFAQPYLPSENQLIDPSGNAVSIYIDNSFSMQGLEENGSLIELAKKRALEIVKAFKKSDDYILLTNDLNVKNQRIFSQEEITQAIQDVQLTPHFKTFDEIIPIQHELSKISKKKNHRFFVLSDFQKTAFSFEKIKILDSNQLVFLLSFKSKQQGNVYVDSVWFEKPFIQLQQKQNLRIKLKNNGEQKVEMLPVKLFLNNTQKAVATVDIEKNSTEIISIPVFISQAGINAAKIEITDHPYVFDDIFYFSFDVKEKIGVLVINQKLPNPFLKALFGKDSAFQLTQTYIQQLDYSLIDKQQFIIINELEQIPTGLAQLVMPFIEMGGSVLIIPSKSADLDSYNKLLSQLKMALLTKFDTATTLIENINIRHNLYSDVFERIPNEPEVPNIYKYFRFEKNSLRNVDWLLKESSGNPVLITNTFGKGSCYLLAFPLDLSCSDFPKQTLFVPTFLKMAIQSQYIGSLFHYISNQPINLRDKAIEPAEVYSISNSKQNLQIIPEQKNYQGNLILNLRNQIIEADNYYIHAKDKQILGLALNYNRKESNLEVFGNDELKQIIASTNLKKFSLLNANDNIIQQGIEKIAEGLPLWKYFIILAIVFIVIEIILIRWL